MALQCLRSTGALLQSTEEIIAYMVTDYEEGRPFAIKDAFYPKDSYVNHILSYRSPPSSP